MLEKPPNPMCNHSSFAAAGSSKDQQRPINVGYRLSLSWIQSFQKVLSQDRNPLPLSLQKGRSK